MLRHRRNSKHRRWGKREIRCHELGKVDMDAKIRCAGGRKREQSSKRKDISPIEREKEEKKQRKDRKKQDEGTDDKIGEESFESLSYLF